MAQAKILINTVAGSNTDLPINTLVQLDNDNTGGETTYAWTIVDQPEGTADTLSNPAIQNPTFTPLKEGTYLIRLVVNAGPSELTDQVVAAVLQVRSNQRIPAAEETTETDLSRGWARDVNNHFKYLNNYSWLGGPVVCVAGETLVPGNAVQVSSVAVLNSGLAGEQTVPKVTKATASIPAGLGSVGIVLNGINAVSIISGTIILVQFPPGIVLNVNTTGRAFNDPVYVSDAAGAISYTPGTNSYQIGYVVIPNSTTGSIFLYGAGGGSGGGTLWTEVEGTPVTTTDATETLAASLTLAEMNAYHLKVVVIGKRGDNNDALSCEYDVTASRYSSSAVIGEVTMLHFQASEEDWDVNIYTSGNDIQVKVTGKASSTIKWRADLFYRKLQYGVAP